MGKGKETEREKEGEMEKEKEKEKEKKEKKEKEEKEENEEKAEKEEKVKKKKKKKKKKKEEEEEELRWLTTLARRVCITARREGSGARCERCSTRLPLDKLRKLLRHVIMTAELHCIGRQRTARRKLYVCCSVAARTCTRRTNMVARRCTARHVQGVLAWYAYLLREVQV